ncbi:MAG: DUF1818 family protein [Thermosynechococcaceae cyanobacterium]
MARQLQQGKGWRLGWHPEAETFLALIGTDDWSIELTRPEFDDFSRLLAALVETLAQMQAELMEGETITCEATSDLIWIQLDGYPDQFCLSFMLRHGRRAEGRWDETATAAIIASLQTIKHWSG